MDLFEQVKKQGDQVRQLKADKATKEDVLAAVDLLKKLKLEFKESTGQDYNADSPPDGSVSDLKPKVEQRSNSFFLHFLDHGKAHRRRRHTMGRPSHRW